MTQRVLVIGGTGYVGRSLCIALSRAGWHVTAMALSSVRTLARNGISLIVGDRNNPTDLKRVCRRGYDVVIDLVAYFGAQTQSLVEILRGRTSRLVHLSTLAVYEEIITPDASEEQIQRCSPMGQSYGAGKAQCEIVLEHAFEDNGFQSVILRSSPIFGPADPVSRENYFLKRLRAGWPIRHPGPTDGIVLIIHLDDLVQALVAATIRGSPTAKAYHLTVRDCPTLIGHLRTIAEIAGENAKLELVSTDRLVSEGFRVHAIPYAMLPRFGVAINAAEKELGFSPVPYERSIQKTVQWYLGRGPQWHASWPGRGSTQSRLCGQHELLQEEFECQHFLGNRLAPSSLNAVTTALAQSDDTRWHSYPTLRNGLSSIARDRLVVSQLRDGKWMLAPSRLPKDINNTAKVKVSEQPRFLRFGAVLEQIPGEDSCYDVFVQNPPPPVQDYGHDNNPMRLRIVTFGQLQRLRCQEHEMAIIRAGTRSDLKRFIAWLRKAHRDGLRVESLRAAASIFIGDRLRQLASRMLGAEEPGGIVWTWFHDLIRLVLRTDLMLLDGSHLLISTVEQPLYCKIRSELRTARQLSPSTPKFLLFRMAGHHLLGDLSKQRLLSVSAMLAAVIEINRVARNDAQALSEYRRLFAASASVAHEQYEAGVAKLHRLGFFRRAPMNDHS